MTDNNLLIAMQHCSKLIDNNIEKVLPADFKDSKLIEAMRYSCLLPGKKIRPFLFKATLEIFDLSFEKYLNISGIFFNRLNSNKIKKYNKN